MKVVFVRRLSKWGGKYVFTVPKQLIDQGYLQPGKLYMLRIEELRGEKGEED
ncbi:MAG: hypothetical protein ACXQTI_02740 [Candidatus Nezhaarchaeales archaeon]